MCLLNCFSCVWLLETPWTVALQAPLSTGFFKQEYWNRLPCTPPGDLPNPGIELMSLISPALAGGFFTTSATWEALYCVCVCVCVCVSRLVVSVSATPWTVALQAPLSTGFFKQEYWNRLPCTPPGDLPDPGIELLSPASPALAGGFLATSATREAH